MSTQKISSVKIPSFDKNNYNLWKRKMLLFIKAANPLFPGFLKNGPFVPQTFVPEATINGELILAHNIPKKISEYTEAEKEKVALDDCLQLIIIESLDNDMHKSIVTRETAKEIWEIIELLYEGTTEVKKNQRQILVS